MIKIILSAVFILGVQCFIQPNPSYANDPLAVFKIYVKQANHGSAGSMNKVAQYHHYGIHMPINLVKAREWYLKAAENGFVYSQHIVADFYAQGIGGPRDLKKAAYWYEQAASLWYLRSQLALAKLYIDPKGYNSPQTAKGWLEILAQSGDPWGQYQLAKLLTQSNLEKDHRQATQWLLKASVQGHTQSQYELGKHYLKAQAADELPKAKYWLAKAASSGHGQANLDLQKLAHVKNPAHGLSLPNLAEDTKRVQAGDVEAIFEFGQNWQQGSYGKRDLVAAESLYRSAALKNHLEAQYHYALILLSGYDDAHFTEKIFEWVMKAAKQGHAKSQYLLGQLYQRGYGPEKNLGRAKYWFEQAAKNNVSDAAAKVSQLSQVKTDVPPPEVARERTFSDMSPAEVLALANAGNPYAQFYLGSQHASKFSAPKYLYDPIKAEAWMLKSAEQGYTYAQFTLGLFYSSGVNIPPDLEKAKYWLSKAAEQGDQTSIKLLKELNDKTSQ
ncbi:MAG: hypothetical protein CVV27_10235 [Candidatus Melainabacteria bacterium HGW-Melainabacteria-1]|nr:MAG: hypothetical protein CVV27_10235 [Candidatus Melainabacteria bacterium HGW-Melainabacteria-1]